MLTIFDRFVHGGRGNNEWSSYSFSDKCSTGNLSSTSSSILSLITNNTYPFLKLLLCISLYIYPICFKNANNLWLFSVCYLFCNYICFQMLISFFFVQDTEGISNLRVQVLEGIASVEVRWFFVLYIDLILKLRGSCLL